MKKVCKAIVIPPKTLWQKWVTPSHVGEAMALLLMALPLSVYPPIQEKPLQSVIVRLIVAFSGFFIGLGVMLVARWCRWRLLKLLLGDLEWMLNSKSIKVKLWAVIVKFLVGNGQHRTYDFQKILPSQPLPKLEDTLQQYLSVAEQLLSAEDFELTKQAVKDFACNEGPQLQQFLVKKAKTEVSWLAEYWLMAAYLSSREPLAFNSNYYMTSVLNEEKLPTNPINRAANVIQCLCRVYTMLVKRQYPPTLMNGMVPLCMHGTRFFFNSVRVPGEHVDSIKVFPGNLFIIVNRRGYYFKLPVFSTDECGKRSPLTLQELKVKLMDIVDTADTMDKEAPPVAVLTSQKRDVWAKHRLRLSEKNSEALEIMESAMFHVTLEDYAPKDGNDQLKCSMGGRPYDRWHDKTVTYIQFADSQSSFYVEHSSVDATVACHINEFSIDEEQYENGDLPSSPEDWTRPLEPVTPVTFDVTGLETEILEVAEAHSNLLEKYEHHMFNSPYGKGYMKKKKLSPDGYVQMMMQLAYYRCHGHIPKTYEPATGRLFALGRTETVHPVSSYSTEWVRSMDDDLVDRETREMLLRKAINHQSQFRLKATVGQGCDRHLLGLYCATREMGMDVPQIFRDKMWQMPFKLSTSQTPTRLPEFDTDVILSRCGGGFGPNCVDGYGISYMHLHEELLNMHVSSWRITGETSSKQMCDALTQAMLDMKKVLG